MKIPPMLYNEQITQIMNESHSFNVRELFQMFQPFSNSVVMSWGISKRIAIAGKLCIMKVNGMLHKGYVILSYNAGTDLFNVHIVTTHGNIKAQYNDIYLEDLVDVIDSEVEKKNTWTNETYKEKLEGLYKV